MTQADMIVKLSNALCKGCREGWETPEPGVHIDPRPDGYKDVVYYEQCLAYNALVTY